MQVQVQAGCREYSAINARGELRTSLPSEQTDQAGGGATLLVSALELRLRGALASSTFTPVLSCSALSNQEESACALVAK